MFEKFLEVSKIQAKLVVYVETSIEYSKKILKVVILIRSTIKNILKSSRMVE